MGLTVRDMAFIMETLAPMNLAESYDNPGLLVGHPEAKVTRIMLSVDASERVIRQAIEKRCEMIIAHHPLIFHPLKNVTEQDPVGRRVMMLCENGIALYAAHTNMDSAPGGNIDYAARLLGLENVEAVGEEGTVKCLRIGDLSTALTLEELAAEVKERFGLGHVRFVGEAKDKVQRVAVCTGSGMDFAKTALRFGADVLVTGDITYHRADDALREGLKLIDATHFGTDRLGVESLKAKLSSLEAVKDGSVTVITADEQDIYTTL